MQWTDIQEIAIALIDQYPQTDPRTIRFTDLHRWIIALDGFNDDPKRSNERILEAIQAAWIEEAA
jgi:FeS assembly protein IscX